MLVTLEMLETVTSSGETLSWFDDEYPDGLEVTSSAILGEALESGDAKRVIELGYILDKITEAKGYDREKLGSYLYWSVSEPVLVENVGYPFPLYSYELHNSLYFRVPSVDPVDIEGETGDDYAWQHGSYVVLIEDSGRACYWDSQDEVWRYDIDPGLPADTIHIKGTF